MVGELPNGNVFSCRFELTTRVATSSACVDDASYINCIFSQA